MSMQKATHPFEGASWIWPGSYEGLQNTYAHFRRDFDLKSVPRSAPFFITADQQYMLYVNGKYVMRGPARGYQHHWPYDEVDLAPFLRASHNWISVRAYNAGISTFQYLHQRAAGMICAGTIGKVDLRSGIDWLARLDHSHRRDVARLSIQINYQEHIDARLDNQEWITGETPPDDWGKPNQRAFGAMPWHSVEPRGIPSLSNTMMPYARLVATAQGACADGFEDWYNLTDGFREENQPRVWTTAPSDASPADAPIKLPASGVKRFSAALLDLGRLGVGTHCIEVTGAAPGDLLDFYCCEILTDEGAPCVPQHLGACWASMSFRLRLREGTTKHETFQLIGHRYLVMIAHNTRQPLNVKVALRHCVYPLDVQGRFESSDTTLNEIHRISVHTQQVCALDAYVDTPWREQGQWWGDARVQGMNTFYLSADARLFARGIRSIAGQEVPNGLTYGLAPTSAHGCILPDFSLIWILTVWDHYYQTGSVELFKEQWPRIQRVLSYFTGEGRDQDGLLRYDPRYWLFLDWTDIHKDDRPTLYNIWYVLTLDKLTTLCRLARMPREAAQMSRLHEEQRRRVLKAFWDAKAGLFHDGLTPKGRKVNVHSVHTQTLAILCGLKAEAHTRMLKKRILPYLRDEKIPGARPSSYWVNYLYWAARKRGYGADAARHIRTHWAPMIPYGGTWEVFDRKAVGWGSSTSHAWAAHPIYHLAGTVGGISQLEAGWKKILFEPITELTHWARTIVPTPHGLVEARWDKRKGKLDATLKLPKGIRAEVHLPGRKAELVGGMWQS